MSGNEMTISPVMSTPGENVELRIALARFETKLDIILGQHDSALKDHEHRIRTIEEKRFVSPAALLASSATVVALLGGTFTILNQLYG